MSDLNQVIVSGRLTRDPEVRYTNSKQAVSDFTVACNRIWKNEKGKQEETIFVDVVVWGKQAENMGNLLSKGKYVMVTGRLKQESWQAQDGSKRSKITVNAEKVDLPPKETYSQSSNSQPVEEEVDFDAAPEEAPF